MPTLNEPKLIAGNANQPLAQAVARRMSMHRGMNVGLVDARIERFNDQEIFVEVYETSAARTCSSSSRPRTRPTTT